MEEIIKVNDTLESINPENYLVGTVFFIRSTRELRRVVKLRNGRKDFKRMTKHTRNGEVLKVGEARYMPTESCKVTVAGTLQYDGHTASHDFIPEVK